MAAGEKVIRFRPAQVAGLAALVVLLALVASPLIPEAWKSPFQPAAPAPAAREPAEAGRDAARPQEVGAEQPARPAPDLGRVQFSTRGWKTDFGTHSVPLSEFMSGGPPRDGIPPVDRPRFETAQQADQWLKPVEPVVHLPVGGEVRGYPLQILTWHEIVNDEVGGVPVSVTFCPLCNTAIAFDRRVKGMVLDFGTTGNLRFSDLVMWDRQTESWWQQATGEAVVGELTGQRLTMLPASIISWGEFRQRFPNGQVLSRDTGHQRDYGRNPYVGYDRVDQSPFLFRGPFDGRLPPMERVASVSIGSDHVAYPFPALQERRVVADVVGGQPLVVFWQAGTTSALDGGNIATSRDVGATGVFRSNLNGRALSFSWRNDAFVDEQTGSRWTVLGAAFDGPLAGSQLEPIVHHNPFWFSWASFKPETRIYR